MVPFVLIAAAGKLALGGHDFSIILQVGRAGLVPAPLVGESMQLMPIIEEDVGGGGGAVQHVGGGRWVGGLSADYCSDWEDAVNSEQRTREDT